MKSFITINTIDSGIPRQKKNMLWSIMHTKKYIHLLILYIVCINSDNIWPQPELVLTQIPRVVRDHHIIRLHFVLYWN